MSTRETVMSQVRFALGRAASQTPAPAPPVRLRIPELTVEQRIESFFCALGRLAGKTYRASSPAEALQYVTGLIGGKPAVASDASFLHTCGVDRIESVRHGFANLAALREVCASAEVGVTSADYALADTGTLVMLSSPEEARMVSLLPPVHVAVVPRERILTGLDELFSVLPRPGEIASSMVLITGPSRTADIEQILVRGVHGPGEIHVVVV